MFAVPVRASVGLLQEISIDQIDHRIDAQKDPVAALGFNGTWPGPRIDVVEGDRDQPDDVQRLPELTKHMIAEIDGAIGWITFNKPERRNAVSTDM